MRARWRGGRARRGRAVVIPIAARSGNGGPQGAHCLLRVRSDAAQRPKPDRSATHGPEGSARQSLRWGGRSDPLLGATGGGTTSVVEVSARTRLGGVERKLAP